MVRRAAGDRSRAAGVSGLTETGHGESRPSGRTEPWRTAWRIAIPVLDVWATLPARDFPNYVAGSWGPPGADELVSRDGRRWVVS
jgi:glucose-6-phosphate 1-dehydrogenase